MNEILAYLNARYQPLAVIVYGSYADGSCDASSDFDALVITGGPEEVHDTEWVAGVRLDVFVYPRRVFEEDFDPADFAQILDGVLALDTDGSGAALLRKVRSWLAARPTKDPAELAGAVAWCRKMLLRARRGDAEGLFRRHWLVTDSLEIFCDLAGRPYLGPKKSLRWMEAACPEAFARYTAALADGEGTALEEWVAVLERMVPR